MKPSEIGTPPTELAKNEVIAKVVQNRGNAFEVLVPESHLSRVVDAIGCTDQHLLVGLSPALRNKFFVRRNGFVLVTLELLGPNGKLKGEITDIVSDLKYWQKTLREWPVEFGVLQRENNALELPPSLSDEEYEDDSEDESDGEAENRS